MELGVRYRPMFFQCNSTAWTTKTRWKSTYKERREKKSVRTGGPDAIESPVATAPGGHPSSANPGSAPRWPSPSFGRLCWPWIAKSLLESQRTSASRASVNKMYSVFCLAAFRLHRGEQY